MLQNVFVLPFAIALIIRVQMNGMNCSHGTPQQAALWRSVQVVDKSYGHPNDKWENARQVSTLALMSLQPRYLLGR